MMRIDAHHHFWKYSVEEYGWIDEEMAAIRRDFLPDDLQREINAAGVDGVVSVQARTSLDETRWLLTFADQHEFIRGVVGWVPLTAANLSDELAALKVSPKLRSVREICQGQPAGFMLRPEFLKGIGLLEKFQLAYDVLIFERQLPETIEFVDRFPNQIFILDHLAKPRIRDYALEPWAENLRELARRPNVYCKVSGMVTEADFHGWTEPQLAPYFETALDAFGPSRLMFGSDWPVCEVACNYARWHSLVTRWCAALSSSEQERILGGTAVEAYGLQ